MRHFRTIVFDRRQFAKWTVEGGGVSSLCLDGAVFSPVSVRKQYVKWTEEMRVERHYLSISFNLRLRLSLENVWHSVLASLVECYSNDIITRIRIQTAGLAFGGTGLCSYRVRGVEGICASTAEFYAVFIYQQSYLLGIPSPTHSFHPRLKTFLLCKSSPLQPFLSST